MLDIGNMKMKKTQTQIIASQETAEQKNNNNCVAGNKWY